MSEVKKLNEKWIYFEKYGSWVLLHIIAGLIPIAALWVTHNTRSVAVTSLFCQMLTLIMACSYPALNGSPRTRPFLGTITTSLGFIFAVALAFGAFLYSTNTKLTLWIDNNIFIYIACIVFVSSLISIFLCNSTIISDAKNQIEEKRMAVLEQNETRYKGMREVIEHDEV